VTTTVTKESLAQWIAELELQPHLSLREERWLAVCKELDTARRCLVVDPEYLVNGSWVGSVQNYIAYLEQQNETRHP